MFRNYLIVIFRNLLRDKVFSAINVLGLSLGLACCFLLMVFIQDELSFDKLHENGDRIYRIIFEEYHGDQTIKRVQAQELLVPTLRNNFSEIEKVTLLKRERENSLVQFGERSFLESRFFIADSDFFEVFSFPFLSGDPKSALNRPNTVVLTESTAKKYFGEAEPLGKSIVVAKRKTMTVTGVIEDLPHNSHFHFDFLGSYEMNPSRQRWHSWSAYVYFLLREGIDSAQITKGLHDLAQKNIKPYRDERYSFGIQPLWDIHLYSKHFGEIEANSDYRYSLIFSGIVFVIMLIACFNYMNLTTARSLRREREVGMRKVFGAQRRQLIIQFQFEAIIFSLSAFLVAMMMTQLTMPIFRDFVQRPIGLNVIDNIPLILGFVLATILVGILSGSYPAFVLSSQKTITSLTGRLSNSGSKSKFSLRRSFIVAQLSITTILAIMAVVIHSQLLHMQNKKLGFDKEHVLIVTDPSRELRGKENVFKERLGERASILHVGAGQIPGRLDGGAAGFLDPNTNERFSIEIREVDHGYFETMGMEIVRGRKFHDLSSEVSNAAILNEAALKHFSYTDDSQSYVTIGQTEYTIIGVVQDYHVRSLREAVEPMIITLNPNRGSSYVVRVAPGSIAQAVADMEKTWKELVPGTPVLYSFLDSELNRLYYSERRLAGLIDLSTLIAIFIACLGLFGISVYSTQRRKKEIGIRKVLGATVREVVTLLSRDYIRLLILANLIAFPIALTLANKWLSGFAYRFQLTWQVFAFVAALGLLLLMATVSAQTIRLALTNPVDTLRSE